MNVQTIPAIEDMTQRQRVELMEELWKVMSHRPEEIEPPVWHLKILKERVRKRANRNDEHIDLGVAMAEIREQFQARKRSR